MKLDSNDPWRWPGSTGAAIVTAVALADRLSGCSWRPGMPTPRSGNERDGARR